MKRGFTLLELMVASLLLAMLVTALTMIFNQSSIAWRTGVADVVDLSEARFTISRYQEVSDDILPGVGNQDLGYRTVSVWKDDNTLRNGNGDGERPYAQLTGVTLPSLTDMKRGRFMPVGTLGQGGQKSSLYIVGVRSLGKDGRPDTADDVTTWPEGVQ